MKTNKQNERLNNIINSLAIVLVPRLVLVTLVSFDLRLEFETGASQYDYFFGLASQVIEEEVEEIASLAMVVYDKECLNEYL